MKTIDHFLKPQKQLAVIFIHPFGENLEISRLPGFELGVNQNVFLAAVLQRRPDHQVHNPFSASGKVGELLFLKEGHLPEVDEPGLLRQEDQHEVLEEGSYQHLEYLVMIGSFVIGHERFLPDY